MIQGPDTDKRWPAGLPSVGSFDAVHEHKWQAVAIERLVSRRTSVIQSCSCGEVRRVEVSDIPEVEWAVHPFTCGTCHWEGPDQTAYFAHARTERHDNWQDIPRTIIP